MLCSAYPQVVGKVFGVVLWRLQFQLTRLVCGNSLLSRCGGSCFALVAELVYAVASKATVRKDVRVRFPLKARTVIGSSLA